MEERLDPGIALLYRLSGDYNPLHLDPEHARAAGYAAPIVHGKCTLGHTCRMLLELLDGQERFLTLQLRYASPVLAGETLQLEVWQRSDEESLGGYTASSYGASQEDDDGGATLPMVCSLVIYALVRQRSIPRGVRVRFGHM